MALSNREEFKEYLAVNFTQGYIPCSVYPVYFFYKDGGLTHLKLTCGARSAGFFLAVPHKYYESWEEMYDDLKFYFDYRRKQYGVRLH